MKYRVGGVLLLLVLACVMGVLQASASSDSQSTGQVGITFYRDKPPGESGGGGTNRPDPPTGSLNLEEKLDGNQVTILDPNVPLTDLGDLPKTGSNTGAASLLILGGLALIASQLSHEEPEPCCLS